MDNNKDNNKKKNKKTGKTFFEFFLFGLCIFFIFQFADYSYLDKFWRVTGILGVICLVLMYCRHVNFPGETAEERAQTREVYKDVLLFFLVGAFMAFFFICCQPVDEIHIHIPEELQHIRIPIPEWVYKFIMSFK